MRNKLIASGSILLVIAGIVVALTFIVQPSQLGQDLDTGLKRLNYTTAGTVSSYEKMNNIDAYWRHVRYDSPAAYTVLMKRL